MATSGSLIVGFDFSKEDSGVLIIGRKEMGQQVTVINAFEGKEAYELYKKLTTVRK